MNRFLVLTVGASAVCEMAFAFFFTKKMVFFCFFQKKVTILFAKINKNCIFAL
jgi:hypothetical protein